MNYTVTVTKHQYCYDIEANSIEEAAELATVEAEENPSNYCTTCDVEENKEENDRISIAWNISLHINAADKPFDSHW